MPSMTRNLKRKELSRTKLELFCNCARCFYDDVALGLKRPSSPPFTLNIAVDELLKREFDVHRAAGTPHPLCAAEPALAGVVPFPHAEMDAWRYNFTGVRWQHPGNGWTLYGAVDDVWVQPDGTLLVVDYKATARAEEVSAAGLYDSYRRQAEVYQFLLAGKGLRVSDTAWFVYANGDKTRAAFGGELRFRMNLVPYVGDRSWVQGKFEQAVACAEGTERPSAAEACEWCAYVERRGSGDGSQ